MFDGVVDSGVVASDVESDLHPLTDSNNIKANDVTTHKQRILDFML